jgi:NAD(P)H-binding
MAGRVLVTGATGNTGRPLVEMLRGRGVQVRVMVRTEAAARWFAGTPVEALVADFDDPDSVSAAVAGVDSAYLVTPSSVRAQGQQERFAELAARAGVRHLVKLSQLGADESSPVGSCATTQPSSGGSVNSNWGSLSCDPTCTSRACFCFRTIREQGQFFAPIADARVSAVGCPRHCRGRHDSSHQPRTRGRHLPGDGSCRCDARRDRRGNRRRAAVR